MHSTVSDRFLRTTASVLSWLLLLTILTHNNIVQSRPLPFGTRLVQPLISSWDRSTCRSNRSSNDGTTDNFNVQHRLGNGQHTNKKRDGTQSTSSLFEMKEVHDYFTSSLPSSTIPPIPQIMNDDDDEYIRDHIHRKEEEDERSPFSFHADVEEQVLIHPPGHDGSTSSFSKKPSFYERVQNVIHDCYQTASPSELYDSSTRRKMNHVSGRNYISYPYNKNSYNCRNRRRSCNTTTSKNIDHVDDVMLKSIFQKLKSFGRNEKKSTPSTKANASSVCTIVDAPETSSATTIDVEEEEEESIQEPSPAILSGIIKPLIPTSIWESLTGHEFYYPSTLANLIQTGIQIASCSNKDDQDDECTIDWKPADSKTKKILSEADSDDDDDDDVDGNNKQGSTITNALLNDNQVLVWIGKFKQKNADQGYGSSLPLIKTISVVPLSPKKFAELLMDSSQVPTYNKMSLGRKDVVVFQQGVDTECTSESNNLSGERVSQEGKSVVGQVFALDGEAKIVRNVTKPPLSKKLMEFVTLMYARRLKSDDKVSAGYLGGGVCSGKVENESVDESSSDSYIVVTRAVSGGRWSSSSGSSKNDAVKARGGGSSSDKEEEEMIRSEILLGVNLLRNIPGEPEKTEITTVTHVYSPSVPAMLAGSVGVKGAIDFIKDIRALCK